MKKEIKIVSSWTRPGGGTVAHINLTNLLNDNGYDCTFYGPHTWHLDKCKAAPIDQCFLGPEDILISHFIQVPEEVRVKKHILYCHERHIFPLKEVPLAQYDCIVFVSNSQKEWQGVNHPSVIIPPLVKKIKWENPNNGVAGVIGSIDKNKQPHLSAHRAIKDGFSTVKLFGEVTDRAYLYKSLGPLLSTFDIRLEGHQDDLEAMYGEVSVVYHSSLNETYGLVEAECRLAGIPFNGTSNNQDILDNEEILDRWRKLLDEDYSSNE